MRSCQAKISVRPASHQHCATKRDFRTSGRLAVVSVLSADEDVEDIIANDDSTFSIYRYGI